VLAWSTITYRAALSAVLAAALVAVALCRPRRLRVIVSAGLTAGLGAAAWNAILHATHAGQFLTDAPVAVLPASWQDSGSGVFALAATAALLGVGPLGPGPARRTIGLAALCGLAAFLVDVYLY
jgi:hypothetical protein